MRLFGSNVIVADEGLGVASVTFSRGAHNHVDVELLRALADAFEFIDHKPAFRATTLRSEGRHFCAGADFNTPNDTGEDPEAATNLLYGEAIRLFAANKPIVAAVQGAAVGAGLGLALVADFRIASEDTRFVANFVQLGFHPGFGLTCTLPRVIGHQRANLMFLTGRRIGGALAAEWGLADELVPPHGLWAAALTLAREIAAGGPLALLATRKTLRRDLVDEFAMRTKAEDAEQRPLRRSQDFAEGVAAMSERRKPNFTGQ